MRLREISEVLDSNASSLVIHSYEARSPDGSTVNRRIVGIPDLMESIYAIQRTGTLQKEIDGILKYEEITNSPYPEMFVHKDTAHAFVALVGDLRNKATLLAVVLHDTLEDEPAHSIDVRLPDSLSLRETGDILITLDKALSQALVNDYVDGQISLVGFDTGSKWLEIALGTASALQLLAGLIGIYFRSRSALLELKQKEEVVRGLSIKNESMKDITEALRKQMEKLIQDQVADTLSNAGIPDNDHECFERIKYSMTILGSLFERGLEIHPATSLPEEEKKSFPNPQSLFTLVKQLGPAAAAELTESIGPPANQ